MDIRKLENHAQNDPDAYGYSGALCRANQGIMEFVEMFKAPIKVLHPLLTATGRQLQRHRRHLRPAVQRHYSGALQRVRVGDLPQQQE